VETRFLHSINEIPEKQWNALFASDYPFIQHSFLQALELTGATCLETGWAPQHPVVYDQQTPVAAMPAYLKSHSYGEFVFDFQWASAYERSGRSYYPKLLSAIPFSPVSGPRLGAARDYSLQNMLAVLLNDSKKYVRENSLSSWHILFPQEALSEQLKANGLLQRCAVQFHWFNDNYSDFDDFLARCNSRHRKNIRKERKKVAEQAINLSVIEGKDITDSQWQAFYLFYQLTYLKHSGHGGYLKPEFFYLLASRMPDHLVMIIASVDQQMVAASLCLKDAHTLYGRYWGCDREFDFLHFETCYYRGIEYCISNGLKRFDPGAQGEHKIQRGFKPVFTYSNHWIENESFRTAIADFLGRETRYMERYKMETGLLLPYKQQTDK
jgi:predicted N-acyltransferase